MTAFAAFVMRGPWQAASVVAAGLALGLILPPFAWLSGAVVALVLLHAGALASVQVMAPALLIGGLAGWFITGSTLAIPLAALMGWLPVLLLAGVLRATVRLDLALLSAAGLGAAIVLAVHATVPDPATAWVNWLETLFPPDQLQRDLAVRADGVRDLYAQVAPLMTGLLAVSVVTSAILALLLARWWQARLYNPGGFRSEFHELRLGRAVAAGALVIAAVAMIVDWPLFHGLALVAGGVLLFQGLAVVHGVVGRRAMSVAWLAAMYILGLILPLQMILAWATIGVVDAWFDFRGRVNGPAKGT